MGVHFVGFVGQYGYDRVLSVLGRHVRDFLNGLDNLHEYLKFSYPRMRAPSFICENETRQGKKASKWIACTAKLRDSRFRTIVSESKTINCISYNKLRDVIGPARTKNVRFYKDKPLICTSLQKIAPLTSRSNFWPIFNFPSRSVWPLRVSRFYIFTSERTKQRRARVY